MSRHRLRPDTSGRALSSTTTAGQRSLQKAKAERAVDSRSAASPNPLRPRSRPVVCPDSLATIKMWSFIISSMTLLIQYRLSIVRLDLQTELVCFEVVLNEVRL